MLAPDHHAHELLERAPCVPLAIAAIAALELHVAAQDLAPRRCGLVGAPMEAAVAVLFERGFRVELWSTQRRGWRLLSSERLRTANAIALTELGKALTVLMATPVPDASDHRARLLAEHGAQFVTAYDRARGELAKTYATRRARADRRHVRSMTVQELCAARPVGTWLLAVDRHALAVRGGVVIAGDGVDAPTYGKAPLTHLFRVMPPGGIWRVRLSARG
jgi:hypothetical protein